jgi:hypothetical protein
MKKLFSVTVSLLLLAGCSEKKAYEQALLEQMQKEQDVKDYNIAPEEMVKCMFETTSDKMPGFFVYDPYRRLTYERYAKMLNASKAPDPKKAFDDLAKEFGSPKKLAEAHTLYTESIMDCYSLINDKRDVVESDAAKSAAQSTSPNESQSQQPAK